ncbi:UNKNOWN [Stylonychia lemnae]|uniref:Uncharacterized protein n=1 Tax=Stylonychia lemnae TaxID=5949 RepID=A0A078AGU0_STYLE|nr:UNKNOWN [Stylonychia lemnae]|eukprot:CDW81424.1 UNKNOWN [Stylonychia lemnae]
MLNKRKQLIAGFNQDLVEDIEENTNFLVAKRKNRIRKGKSLKDKYLYHTIGDGFVKGGIIIDGSEQQEQISLNNTNMNMNKTLQISETISNHMYNQQDGKNVILNNTIGDEQHNTQNSAMVRRNSSSLNYRRPSTAHREDSFIYQSKAPRIQFNKKIQQQQDDIIAQLNQQPQTIQQPLQDENLKSRNIQTSQGFRATSQINQNVSTMSTQQKMPLSQRGIPIRGFNNTFGTVKGPQKNLNNNEFIAMIKNRGEYRRDKMVKKLTNQFIHSVQPMKDENQQNKQALLFPITRSIVTCNKSATKQRDIKLELDKDPGSPFCHPMQKYQSRPQSQNAFARPSYARRESMKYMGSAQIEIHKVSKFAAQT